MIQDKFERRKLWKKHDELVQLINKKPEHISMKQRQDAIDELRDVEIQLVEGVKDEKISIYNL